MSESEEIALGRKTHASVMKQYTEYDNPGLKALVNRLGQELAAQSHRSHLDFTFTVLDSPEVNAFATPGGYVYITRGIMAYMNKEEQLAGVLGHEIGHVTARHSVRQHSAQTAAQTAAGIASIAVAILTQSTDAGQLTGQATGELGQAFVSGYGRDHELEADRLGAQYLAGIGYDPEMMLGVVGILKDQEEFDLRHAREEGRQPRAYHGVFSTHPRNDQRLQEVVRAAEEFRIADARHSDPDAFLELMNGVTFGNSENQGMLYNNNFYHKGLDLAMTFPSNWQVANQPTRLVALNQGQNSAILVGLDDIGSASSPEQFLRENFQNLRNGESIDQDSYTAVTQGKTPFGQGPVRVAAVFHGNNVLVINGFARNGLPDRDFFQTVKSVRRLNTEELQLATEKKIRLVRTKNGDSFARLAEKSSLTRYAEDQLMLLNGLYPDGEPEPGQLIKIIQ
jgi:predicted Zn-dependent protease